MTENRPANAPFNARVGTSPHNSTPRVTGAYTGTTDEIIQWAACKWGLDEDWARAQAAIESWHRQNDTFGDFGSDPAACLPGHPIGADGVPGQCPQSIGLLQVRYPFHQEAFEDNNAIQSTSYNADYAWSIWRACYNGELTWLNTVERGREYAAGDQLGCMGVWFSGRWYTPAAVGYMDRVRDEFFEPRVWEQAGFPPAQPTGGTPSTTTTTTTVAPTTTGTAATTTTVAATTTTTTTTQPPPVGQFLAEFGTPQDFYGRFDTDVHFRANDYDRNAEFHGDHNMACQGPDTSRTVHLDNVDNQEVFWWCAPNGPDTGHVMTGMGPAGFGYSIVTFKPKQAFTGVDRVCVDVNGTDLGGDNWWEMSVVPKATFDANGGRMDYVTAVARDIDDTALSFPSSAFVYQIWDNKIRLYQGMSERVFDWFGWSTSDRAARFKHCMVDNGNGTVTVTRRVGMSNSDAPGGVRSVTVPGSFPAGQVVVLFQQSIYDPPKHGSGPTQTTFHWDNVEVSP